MGMKKVGVIALLCLGSLAILAPARTADAGSRSFQTRGHGHTHAFPRHGVGHHGGGHHRGFTHHQGFGHHRGFAPHRGFGHHGGFAHHKFFPHSFGFGAGVSTPIVVYSAPPVFYAPPPQYVTAPVYAPPVVYSAPPPSAPPPPMPRVVEYPTGRYELRGDGVTAPYTWVWIPNPPAAPPAPPAPAPSTEPSSSDVAPRRRMQAYRWVDEHGVVHWTDRPDAVPRAYRDKEASRP